MIENRTCNLYRNLYDIVHPSISRKNISNYKIVFKDNLIPIRVFYPKKEVTLKKIILYIHGNIVNYDIYDDLAKRTDNIVFLLDYTKTNKVNECIDMIKYIYDETKKYNLLTSDLTIIGDFEGSDIILDVFSDLEDSYFKENKKILVEPTNMKLLNNTVIITNNKYEINDKNIKLYETEEDIFGFINDTNLMAKEYIFKIINDEINDKGSM